MKALLLSLLFLRPFILTAQGYSDSLKKIFLDRHNSTLSKDCEYERMFWGQIDPQVGEIDELFDGAFKNIILYSVRFDFKGRHEPPFNPDLYALDKATGKFVSFENEQAFFKFINSARTPLANLDKAYLYLFLVLNNSNEPTTIMTTPENYKTEVYRYSIFAGQYRPSTFFQGSRYYEQKQEVIFNSTAYEIHMHVGMEVCDPPYEHSRYEYIFKFNDQNDLIDISRKPYR